MKKNLFIEAGHGGGDPGAIAYDGTHEAALNVELRDSIIRALADINRDASCLGGSVMNMITDHDNDRLWKIVRQVNAVASSNDFLLSIHFNFNHPTATGTEVLYSPATTTTNKKLAAHLSEQVAETIGIHNRGAKPSTYTRFGKLAILDGVKPRALLLEVCFLNEHDLTAYRAVKQQVAEVVADIIVFS